MQAIIERRRMLEEIRRMLSARLMDQVRATSSALAATYKAYELRGRVCPG